MLIGDPSGLPWLPNPRPSAPERGNIAFVGGGWSAAHVIHQEADVCEKTLVTLTVTAEVDHRSRAAWITSTLRTNENDAELVSEGRLPSSAPDSEQHVFSGAMSLAAFYYVLQALPALELR